MSVLSPPTQNEVKLQFATLLVLCLCFTNTALYSQPSAEAEVSSEFDVDSLAIFQEEMALAYQRYADSLSATFEYKTGVIELRNGIATLTVPEGFRYLDEEDSRAVLVDLWGNPPPPNPEDASMGMLFPNDYAPTDTTVGYAIDISFTQDGYVDDADAKDIDYDDLLAEIQEGTKAENEARQEIGYGTVDVVGWASEPFYDATNKKLHWAQELAFEGSELNMLNYNVRVLGRRGFMTMNVIGEMETLSDVKANIDTILPSVEFNEGHRYEDFDSSIDEVAAYGIGGLIAGKMLLKAGLFAKLGLFLAKFWKLIALGAVALGAGAKRFLGRKKESSPHA